MGHPRPRARVPGRRVLPAPPGQGVEAGPRRGLTDDAPGEHACGRACPGAGGGGMTTREAYWLIRPGLLTPRHGWVEERWAGRLPDADLQRLAPVRGGVAVAVGGSARPPFSA